MANVSKLSLCPLLSLLLSVVSCGKKLENGQGEDVRRREGVLPPEEVVLDASMDHNAERVVGKLKLTNDGHIQLPKKIGVTSGNAGNYSLKLFINATSEDYEFVCTYKGGSSVADPLPDTDNWNKGLYYNFVKCEDIDGRDIGITAEDLETFNHPIDKGRSLELYPLGAHPHYKTVIKAIFNVKWF